MALSRHMMPSPAVSIVGRHDSGKTTLVEKIIAELTHDGLNVGSIKHHGHAGFDIDVPGKDSWRHRQAGATDVMIAAPGQIARISKVEDDLECQELVALMPGHDIVIVEGYRKSGLPSIEVMRAGNPRDEEVALLFKQAAENGTPLTMDYVQAARAAHNVPDADVLDSTGKMPTAATIAVVSDIPAAIEGARLYGIPCFDLDDTKALCDFLQAHYVRQRMSVVIQAGGESRRMGRSKATVPFMGRPLIMRLVERLAPVADEIVITTNGGEDLSFLNEQYPDMHIRLVSDILPQRGALPGLYTALAAAENEFVAVVACDMVFASPRLIAAESVELTHSRADAVVPVNTHGFEPLHALYRKSVCLDAIKQALDDGEMKAQAVCRRVNIVEFPQARVLRVEPMGGCFVNVNTPEHLQAIEARVREEEAGA